MPIRAVLFDLGGTIIDELDPLGWAEAAAVAGLSVEPDHLAHAYREVEAELDRPEPPELVPFWTAVLERASGTPPGAEVVSKFIEAYRVDDHPAPMFSDVRYCLERLDAEGRAIGLISNSRSEQHCRADLERIGILGYFRVVVSSGTEKVRKPDPEIFRRAVERLGVRPSEVCFVGNLAYRDARAATRAGLHGVWLHRYGWGFGEDPPEITSLTELPAYVRGLEGA